MRLSQNVGTLFCYRESQQLLLMLTLFSYCSGHHANYINILGCESGLAAYIGGFGGPEDHNSEVKLYDAGMK